MTSKEDKIMEVLHDLLRLEDIYACMVAKKNMEGVIPDKSKFRKEILSIWEILKSTMNDFFKVIEQYSESGLREVYFRLRDYEVMFFILPETDTAVVAVIPALANRGLLEIAMENARRKIIDIIEENDF